MTMKIKGSKARADVSAQISMITDMDTGDVISLSHELRSFMKIPAGTTRALVQQGQTIAKPQPAGPKLKSTGRKARINGYDAEEFQSDLGSVKMSYWIAKAYPDGARILNQLARFQQAGLAGVTADLAPGPKDFPGLPIRTEVDLNGQHTVTTLVSAHFTTVDPNDFQIPSGYKELPAPALAP